MTYNYCSVQNIMFFFLDLNYPYNNNEQKKTQNGGLSEDTTIIKYQLVFYDGIVKLSMNIVSW